VCGDEFADGVPEQQVGLKAPGFEKAKESDFENEKGRLSESGLVEVGCVLGVFGGEEDVAQREGEVAVEVAAGVIECITEQGEGVVEGAAHGMPLAALSGEEHGELAAVDSLSEDGARSGGAVGEGMEGLEQSSAVGRDECGAMVEVGARGSEGGGDVEEFELGMVREMGVQSLGLSAEGHLALGGQQHGQGSGQRQGRLRFPYFGRRRLLENDMGVGAREAEGGNAGTSRTAIVVRSPREGGIDDVDGERVPVDVRIARKGVQGGGQGVVAQGNEHLGDAGESGSGLEMSDVGFDGADEERLVGCSALTVDGGEGLHLDGVTERRAGAVALDDIDVGGG